MYFYRMIPEMLNIIDICGKGTVVCAKNNNSCSRSMSLGERSREICLDLFLVHRL